MALNYAEQRISEADYLDGEKISEIKHEFIDGVVYAMAGANKNHQRITLNLVSAFGIHLENTLFEPFSSNVKVKVNSAFFYPDVMVVCDNQDSDPYYTESPVIVVEVLSASTRKTDETIKRRAYQSIPSLKEYVLIEQDIVDVEVCRRTQGWISEHYFLDDEVTFEAIDLTLSVADIYQRVENDDMRSFLPTQNNAL
ncbi:MAG: Uma2 family endonuclease [Methylococcales bacterium]|nr:Uma2 family endonuclease [Methylococcaceae bacterium]